MYDISNRKVMGAVNDYGDYADDIADQGSRLKGQANYLRRLSGKFGDISDTLNNVGINNLLKYGEVSESDLVGQAATDNSLAYGKALDASQRNLTRMGINPNSGRFAGMNQSFALKRAAAEAGARNQARLQARNENFQRANTIAGLGYNYSNLGLSAANSTTSALNSATSAINSAANQQAQYANMLNNLKRQGQYAKAIGKLK